MPLNTERPYIKVLCQFEHQHCWLNAPDEVAFLRNLHRHMFGVVVCLEVFKNDREIEFYIFKNWLQEQIDRMDKPKTHSCEMFCDDIAKIINSRYPKRKIEVEVNEDYMEGAVKQYAD